MIYYVYILECANNALYTGITTDVGRRLDEHNGERTGGSRYTRMHRPAVLRYSEQHPSRAAALKREYVIKQMRRSNKLALIAATHPKAFLKMESS